MYEKALLLDGKAFTENHKISAKRPADYWLLFLKRYVLNYEKPRFHKHYLIFFLPVIVLIILLIFGVEAETVIAAVFISGIFCLIIGIIMSFTRYMAFVPIEVFHELAKFIISIKGDIYKNEVALRLNSGKIEDSKNLLDPYAIGLTKRRGVKYKPFELERFKANFNLKDGSLCVITLNQVTLRVSTTKRRSSGKIKTKMKHKHKFFYVMTLKLKDSDYLVHDRGDSVMFTDHFDIVLKTIDEFHYVKVKYKVKTPNIPSVIKASDTHEDDIYTEMLAYLSKHEIMTKTNNQTLIQ